MAVARVLSLQWTKQLGLPLLGWMLFLVGMALYCIIYSQLVLLHSESFINALWWSFCHFGQWLLLTPLLFWLLPYMSQQPVVKPVVGMILVAVFVLGIAVWYRVDLALSTSKTIDWLVAFIQVLPDQMLTLSVLMLFWLLTHNLRANTQSERDDSTASSDLALPEPEARVLVSKGQGECLLAWRSVDFISTAGNYVELTANAQTYLLRTTMKQLEQRLPPGVFVRIHRCHMVNLDAIAQILPQPGGNASITLRCGRELPMSKGYKPFLHACKFHPA